MINIGIVDDHAIVRSGLRQFFAEHVDLCVAGEAANGREAIDLVRLHAIDVLVMDLSMPGQSGLDALAMLRAKAPDMGILILSGYPEEHYAINLIRQGASGYLNKECDPEEIVKAIRTYNELHCSNEVYEEQQPFVLGLTTGRTPLGLYRELVKRHKEGLVSFRNVAVFSLDEFYPIRSTEQQSRNFRIHEDFLNHIDILPENIHIPDGTVPEARISEYCASYDHSVRKIDLMIIGVGEDGQIGFNEPGSYSRSRTRLVQLTYNTRKIQSGAFFGLENTPKMAVTMGIVMGRPLYVVSSRPTRPALRR